MKTPTKSSPLGAGGQKICVITGTRAEYGLLFPLMKAIKEDNDFDLQIIVTGMHLSPEFGLTYKIIENEGFVINEKVEMLLSSDSEVGITKSTGLGMIGFADAFARLKPDLVILLGDRFEAFAAATAAFLAKIPIAHLHGGETTEGATDEALRHAITKMSYWHFTSTETYRKRVIQLGENPERVFNVGAIGLDNIKKIELADKKWLIDDLKFDIESLFLLITYHPVTLENNSAEEQFTELLTALDEFKNLKFIFTKPNADANGRVIIRLIDEYVNKNKEKAIAFTSLGQKRYLSLMQFTAAVVGNSSSGIIEAPSFNIPTVNIGDRQKGRVSVESIINTQNDANSIKKGIEKAISSDFQAFCKTIQNIYGDGNTTEKIIEILKQNSKVDLKKSFYDLS
jgi:GDP/UDP-N,N'-diacetylbacillosamine 2-epimerase (hydrolysing)